MKRKFTPLLMAVLTAIAVLLSGTGQAFAAADQSAAVKIAADIRSVANLPTNSDTTETPSLDNLLLTPDTGGVAPVKQGSLTVWPNAQPGVSYAAQFLDGRNNTQQFVHISSAEAPTYFTYTLKPGFTAKPGPNGSALIYDSTGVLKRAAPAPWATDANGRMVLAHYRFTDNGTTLTKAVEHNLPGVAYPVVADPIVIWLAIAGAIFLTKCAVNGGWEASQLKGRKWYVVLWRVGWVCVAP